MMRAAPCAIINVSNEAPIIMSLWKLKQNQAYSRYKSDGDERQ